VLRIWDVYPGSRILIFTHPGSRISDPGSKYSNKREGWKKFFVITFYAATNFTKLQIILVLDCWRKKFGPIFTTIELFTPKIVTKLSKIWVWDPGSGKNLFRIPDPGVTKAPDPGSGSATLKSMWYKNPNAGKMLRRSWSPVICIYVPRNRSRKKSLRLRNFG
jgi:hypothetical protein